MNKVAYEQKEKDVLKLPYSTRYQALKQEKIRVEKNRDCRSCRLSGQNKKKDYNQINAS